MNKEEKKALEYLRKNAIVRINIDKNGKEKIIAYGNAYKYTILNLIEKQQKEIEELKEENNWLHTEYDEMFDTINELDKNSISKDKIRYYYKKICASVNHFKNKDDNNIVLRIKRYLEELLEGENNE